MRQLKKRRGKQIENEETSFFQNPQLSENPNPSQFQNFQILCRLPSPMASRCRSLSRPAFSLLKSSVKVKKTANISSSILRSPATCPFPSVPRGAMGSLESLLPFHSAVSSARLTSRLGIDSAGGSRSLSQGTLCSSNPGV